MHISIDLVIPAFNVAGVIEHTIQRVSKQELPRGCQFRCYVFDDASTDDTPGVLARLKEQYDFLHVVRAGVNVGRGKARNNGAAAGSGSIIVFCDADCRYTRDDAILEFVRDIGKGSDAVIGVVELEGDGFWARYTNSVLPSRIKDFKKQGLMAFGTTTNIAIRRSTFESLDGYSDEYRKYGFEDKDFLVRLDWLTNKVSLRPDIRVSHDDDLTLPAVCRKFAEAGQYTSPVFHSEYPDEYKKLSYAKCDASLGKLRRTLSPASAPIRKVLQWVAHLALKLPMPFILKRTFVRVALCAAYFDGTARHFRSAG